MRTIIVTRHEPTIEYLRESGIAPDDATVRASVTAEDIKGCHVIGFLPLHLAAEAARITTVPLPRPGRDAEGRMVELTLEQIRAGAGTPSTYEVRRV